MYELIHANCIDALRNMPDRAVDCIVTDMPYGIGVDFGDYCDSVENLTALIANALPEMRRVAHRTIIVGGVRNLHLYPQPTWTLAWCYGGAGRGAWGFSHWKPILAYGVDPDLRARILRPDVIRGTTAASTDANEHPSPKPLSFMRKLINHVAPSPADVILDPFMGSGTTGVAAIQLGHKFIGIEMNGDYLAIAKRRIAQASPDFQLTLDLKAKDITHANS
jgi:DNA modification methylase